MRTDESISHISRTKTAHSAPVATLGDPPGTSVATEYDDHYHTLRNATVMMVDDEPTTIEILQAFLEDEGYRHFVTTNQSTQALELLAHENPDRCAQQADEVTPDVLALPGLIEAAVLPVIIEPPAVLAAQELAGLLLRFE